MRRISTLVLGAAIALSGTLKAQENSMVTAFCEMDNKDINGNDNPQGLLHSCDTLNVRQRSIAGIASCTGRGDLDALKPALAEGLDGGMTVNEIREVLVHTYAYCGFPRCLRALQTFIAVLDERKAKGIKDTIGRDASPVTDSRSRYERGRDILAEISGVPADAPKAAYAEFAPVIERFLKEHLFADLFERDVLTYADRELATVAVIAALGESVEPMLRGHVGICRNLGYTQPQLDEALAIARADAAKHKK